MAHGDDVSSSIHAEFADTYLARIDPRILGAFSFRLRFVIQPIYFIRRIQWAAEHLNSRLMPIFVRKCAPSDHCLLQGGAFD
jgi:hypothetical protein